MTIEKSTALEEGDIALELTEQKINMMVLDICHKPDRVDGRRWNLPPFCQREE